MSRAALEARFLEGPRGKLLTVLRVPAGLAHGPCVLFVPPFAEELNKSRRMFSEVAEALAARGVATLFPDLHGTGDSAGEFRDADWNVWKAELVCAAAFAQERGWAVTGMLGLRLGCALGAEALADMPNALERCVFWAPVLDGERFITQFLRLRVAASMMGEQKVSVADMRKLLQAGNTLEVAGYELPPVLIDQIEKVRLANTLSEHLGELHWMEIVRDAESPLPPASDRILQSARERLPTLKSHAVPGVAFWATTEIATLPELVSRTVNALAPQS